MSKIAKNSDESGKAAAEQKGKHEVLTMVDWFLDSVIYDLVTWIALAFCIGLTLIYLFAVSPRNWRGVFWSVIALAICASIMIAVRIDQRFFRDATAKARDAQKLKEEIQPSVGVYTINLLKPLAVGEHPTVRVIFQNGPRVSIEGFASYARLVVHNKSIAEAIKDFPVGDCKSDKIGNVLIEGQQRVVDYPQMNLMIDANRVAAITARALHLYVIGKACYRANGREYSFPFYALYEPSDGGFTEPENETTTMKDDKKSDQPNTSITRSVVNSPGAVGNVLGDVSIHHHAPPPRRVTLAQANKMIPVLRPYAGSTLGIAYLSNNNEAFTYADDIVRVFQHSGWDVTDLGAWFGSSIRPGLTCEGKFPIAEAAAVLAAFREAELPIAERPVPGWQEGKWQLVVGEKLS